MTLPRDYELGPLKSLNGMAGAIQDFFQSYSGVDVKMVKIGGDNCVVLCRSNSLVRKASGFDMNVKVSFIRSGNRVTVDYSEKINNAVRTIKAIGMSFFLLGIPQLAGAKERHELPDKVHNVIREYLG